MGPLLACAPAHAQQAQPDDYKPVTDDTVSKADETAIAKELQNPVGNLTILPLENYTNFGFGPHDGTQNILECESASNLDPNQIDMYASDLTREFAPTREFNRRPTVTPPIRRITISIQ